MAVRFGRVSIWLVVAALAAHPGVAALGVSATTRAMAAQAMFAAHGELETLADFIVSRSH